MDRFHDTGWPERVQRRVVRGRIAWSLKRYERRYARRYPHRFVYAEVPEGPVHVPIDSYRYRKDVKTMRRSGTDASLIDMAVGILARGNCLPASFDARYTFADRRVFRDCRVGGGWRLIYRYSDGELVLVGLYMESDRSRGADSRHGASRRYRSSSSSKASSNSFEWKQMPQSRTRPSS